MNCFKYIIYLLLICNLFNISHSLAKTMTVGISNLDYAPFYFESNGELKGASVEIANLISKKLGHKLKYIRLPWKRVQYYLKHGRLDMVILYGHTKERANDVFYTDKPYIYEISHLFSVNKLKNRYLGLLSNLKPYRFGHVRGYSHGRVYDHAKGLIKSTVVNEGQLVKMLINGRFDIAVGNKYAILEHQKNNNIKTKLIFHEPPLNILPNYMAFSKKKAGAFPMVKIYSKALGDFMKTAKYEDILKKYKIKID